jgi:chitinase
MQCNVTKLVCRTLSLFLALLLAACGGGGTGSSASSGVGNSTPSGGSYAVGGTVTGLSGTVVLQNNHGDNLTVTSNGAFGFANRSASGSAYGVTVYFQPTGQNCSVTNGTGTVSSAAITNVAVNCASTTTQGIWVMGYYVGYHSGIQPPAMVDYSAMTHVMVGALQPTHGGNFDESFYIGATNGPLWAKETVRLAHLNGTKAILMVGGAGASMIAAFREVSDPNIRATFVANLKAIVDKYGFDGVDMDWEPLQLSGTPDDRPAFLALSQDLRAAMPDKVMTIPVGWNNSNSNNMDNTYFGTLAGIYDRLNMMSYQMNWTGSGWYTWHSSALFGATGHTPSSIDNTVQALINSGVPKAKIGIGMGFYGQPYENAHWANGALVYATSNYVTGPGQNSDNTVIQLSDNDVSYSNIMHYYYEAAALKWDDIAKASYLSFSTPKEVHQPSWATIKTTYLTYEDERSIAEKGTYVKQQGLGGVIIWTISEGYLDWQTSGEKDPLMKATKAAFLQ